MMDRCRVISACSFLTLLPASAAMAVPPSQEWVAVYNGPTNDSDSGRYVEVDGSGNVYVAGDSEGVSTGLDYTTIKYDSNGNFLWESRYNGPGNASDQPWGLGVDAAGDVYVGGSSWGSGTNNDYAVVKYNGSGEQQWVMRYNGPGNGIDTIQGMAVDPSGNVYVTGQSQGSGTGADMATIKYTSDGTQAWVSRYNSSGAVFEEGFAVTFDASGNVFVTGVIMGGGAATDVITIKYNSSGVQQWAMVYDSPDGLRDYSNAIAVDPADGSVYVAGHSETPSSDYDGLLIKYSSSGSQVWAKRVNGPGGGWDLFSTTIVDSSGNVYVAGETTAVGGDYDCIIMKFNGAGTYQWDDLWDSPAGTYNSAERIGLDGTGGVYLTGYTEQPGNSGDMLTLMYDLGGTELWAMTYGGTGYDWDEAYDLAFDAAGNVYVVGECYNSGSDYDFVTIMYKHTVGIDEPEAVVIGQSSVDLWVSPNPSEGTAVITYGLAVPTQVSVEVFDLSGRSMANPVSLFQQPGQYQVPVNGLAPGIYFCRLSAGGVELTERLAVID